MVKLPPDTVYINTVIADDGFPDPVAAVNFPAIEESDKYFILISMCPK